MTSTFEGARSHGLSLLSVRGAACLFSTSTEMGAAAQRAAKDAARIPEYFMMAVIGVDSSCTNVIDSSKAMFKNGKRIFVVMSDYGKQAARKEGNEHSDV